MPTPIMNSPRGGCCGLSGALQDLAPPKPGEPDVKMADGGMYGRSEGKSEESDEEQQVMEDGLGMDEDKQQKTNEPGENEDELGKNEKELGKIEDKQQRNEESLGENEDELSKEEDKQRRNENKPQKNEKELGKNDFKIYVLGGGDADKDRSADSRVTPMMTLNPQGDVLLRELLAQAMQ